MQEHSGLRAVNMRSMYVVMTIHMNELQVEEHHRYNRYGFQISEAEAAAHKRMSEADRRLALRHENERNEKWMEMYKNWSDWAQTSKVWAGPYEFIGSQSCTLGLTSTLPFFCLWLVILPYPCVVLHPCGS